MDSSYRPQSPDLSGYAPQSPDLSGYQPQSPDLSGVLPPSHYGGHQQLFTPHQDQFTSRGGYSSNPAYPFHGQQFSTPLHQQPQHSPYDHYNMPPSTRSVKLEAGGGNGFAMKTEFKTEDSQLTAPMQTMPTRPPSDPTLGVQLRTSFPVARIKRIMQADEDIGKVAQVTPHVVSRALELFMIKLISASAAQARSGGAATAPTTPGGAGGSGGKGPRRILAQHLKRAIKADVTFDFLADIVNKVPDVPVKGKRDVGSDSEDGGSGAGKAVKRKGRKRKNSVDDV